MSSGRGEVSFTNLPYFGAKLYDNLTRADVIKIQFEEIAKDLVSRISHGRLLDIGTGPGRLLLEIHRLNSNIELFGLDISDAMVELAKKNLARIRANLQQGNIRHTNYTSNFFDVITCTGSFYLWDQPEECLEEIYRILKDNQSAYLYETHKDYSRDEFRPAMKANLQREKLFRRLMTPFFLKKQLRMTYQTHEIAKIVSHTSFANSFTIEKLTLAGLPIWLRIELTKN